MNKPSRKSVTLLIAAVCALLASSAAYSLARSAVYGSAGAAIAAKDAARSADASAEQGRLTMALYASTTAERADLAGFFVPADDEVAFIEAVESAGKAAGVQTVISSISASSLSGASVGAMGGISAHVSLNGTWAGVMRALQALQNMSYGASVDYVYLTVSVPGGDVNAQAAQNTLPVAGGMSGQNAGHSGLPQWDLALDIKAPILVRPLSAIQAVQSAVPAAVRSPSLKP